MGEDSIAWAWPAYTCGVPGFLGVPRKEIPNIPTNFLWDPLHLVTQTTLSGRLLCHRDSIWNPVVPRAGEIIGLACYMWYCWWVKSGKKTSWYGKHPIIYRVLYIPDGCLGFLNHQQYLLRLNWSIWAKAPREVEGVGPIIVPWNMKSWLDKRHPTNHAV